MINQVPIYAYTGDGESNGAIYNIVFLSSVEAVLWSAPQDGEIAGWTWRGTITEFEKNFQLVAKANKHIIL